MALINNDSNNTVPAAGFVPVLLTASNVNARGKGAVRVRAAEMMGVPLYPDDLLEVRETERLLLASTSPPFNLAYTSPECPFGAWARNQFS